MIARNLEDIVKENSLIRAMFEEGKLLAEKYGKDNVFDFSIGNPNVPPPKEVNEAIIDIVKNTDPNTVHGYMNNAGFPDVREAIAEDLNRRYNKGYTKDELIMVVGAASGLNITLRTLLNPGDEVILLAPYFLDYVNYIENYGGVPVPVDTKEDFMPDYEKLAKAINFKTAAIIVNNPNNPTGVIYKKEQVETLGRLLEEKSKEFGRPIYLISDEPYRELNYTDFPTPWIPDSYKNTIVVYSYSKSLSIPGERIGYILCPSSLEGQEEILEAMTIVNRIYGFVNAPSLIQLAVGRCTSITCDIDYYKENSKILYEGLKNLGFQTTKPEGAFYLWLKTPQDDKDFVARAKKYNILLVAGSAFGGSGYVRISYCVEREKIQNSLKAFEKLANEYGLNTSR